MNTAKEKEHGLESVEVSYHAPDAGSVFLAGTFNAWDPNACQWSEQQKECGW
jgi:1,4-alpha-glucan branching enzyme